MYIALNHNVFWYSSGSCRTYLTRSSRAYRTIKYVRCRVSTSVSSHSTFCLQIRFCGLRSQTNFYAWAKYRGGYRRMTAAGNFPRGYTGNLGFVVSTGNRKGAYIGFPVKFAGYVSTRGSHILDVGPDSATSLSVDHLSRSFRC